MKYMNPFKNTAAALMIAITALTGCKKDEKDIPVVTEEPPKIMTMTMTAAGGGKVEIQLAGTGEAVIYWGNDTTPDTVTLQTSPYTFSGTTHHTIVIDGQNITHLYCGYLQLTALDVSNNTALTSLSCSGNYLTSLNVTNNTALTNLECSHNPLTGLDVSKNTKLIYLSCYNNQLTNLDVTKNTVLERLGCGSNQLKSLDVSKNTKLIYLFYANNQLTNLDVTKNTVLQELDCRINHLTAAGLNALLGTLHSKTMNNDPKIIYIYGNPGTNYCDQSIATAKGWTVR